MDDNGTAKPGTGPHTHIPVWPQLPEGEALHRAAVALERIADALEAGPRTELQRMNEALETLCEMVAANEHYDEFRSVLLAHMREAFYEAVDATRQKEE